MADGLEVKNWLMMADEIMSPDTIVDIYYRDGDIAVPDVSITLVPDGDHIHIWGESNSFNKMHYQLFIRARPLMS